MKPSLLHKILKSLMYVISFSLLVAATVISYSNQKKTSDILKTVSHRGSELNEILSYYTLKEGYTPEKLQKAANDPSNMCIVEKVKKVSLSTPYGYNPSFIKDKDGYLLVYRKDEIPQQKLPLVSPSFYSYIYATRLDNQFNQSSPSVNISQKLSSYAEDPRILQSHDRALLVYNAPRLLKNVRRSLHVGQFNKETMQLSAAHHLPQIDNTCEKNWTPFQPEKGNKNTLVMAYKTHPHTIITHNISDQTNSNKTTLSPNPHMVEWEKLYGTPRGGTPAIKVNNEYLSFFHSSFRDSASRTTWYVMGAYTFSIDAPHVITGVSKEPICFNGMYDSKIEHTAEESNRVIFPGGLIEQEDKLLVAIGENDCAIKILTLDTANLLKSLRRD